MGKEGGNKLQKGIKWLAAPLIQKGERSSITSEEQLPNDNFAKAAARKAVDGGTSGGSKQGRPEQTQVRPEQTQDPPERTQDSHETQLYDNDIEGKKMGTMERIYRHFRYIQKEIPSIKLDSEVGGDCTLFDIDLNVRSLIRAYERVYWDMKNAKADVVLAKERAHALKEETTNRYNRYEDQLKILRKDNDKLDERARNLDAKVIRLEREHREKIGSLKDEHRIKLNDKERTIEGMAREHTQVKDAMSRSFEDVKSKLIGLHQREKNKLENDLRQIEGKHSRQLERNQEHFDQELARKERDIQALIRVHDDEKEKMKNDFGSQLNEKALIIEDLKGGLVKRDHFKGMSDQILANRFQDIRSQIEQFACITWDEGLEYRWPISRASLRNAPNERKTKQYILQNSLWVVLYEKIFRTPFRVFGTEGKSFEASWLTEFGRDRGAPGGLALCPPPTKKSEKWRYENIKVCSDATSKPEVEWDFDLKRDYDSYLEQTSKELCEELEQVATITNSQRGKIKNLVGEAATLWVEVGQQRCRMFLLMSNIGDKPTKLRRNALDNYRPQTIEFVVMPELRRKGNVQGEGLETEELVMDCKGDFVMFDHP